MNPLNNNEEELKRQLDGQQFPFDETQWEAARELLDRELPLDGKRKKRAVWLYIAIPVASLLVVAGVWFFMQENAFTDTHKQFETQKNDTQDNTKQPNTTSSAETTANGTDAKAQNNNNTNTQQGLSIGKPTPHLKQDISDQSNGSESEDNNTPNLPSEEDITLQDKDQVTMPPTIGAKIELPEADLKYTKLTALPDTMGQLPKLKARDRDKQEKFPQNYISPFFALNNSRVINPDTANYYGKNLSFGILFNQKLTKRIGYITGITYSRVQASALEKTYNAEEYSFGIEKTSTVISTNTLHYLELPLLVQYSPAKRFSLSAGLTGSYLLNTGNAVTQYTSESVGGHTVSSHKATSYRRGLQSWDLQWQLGMEASLLKNNQIHIGFLAGYGLFDITLNNYYKNTVIDRNGRIQFYIRYDIFKF